MPRADFLYTVQSSHYTWRLFEQKIFNIMDAAWCCFAYGAKKLDVTSIFLHRLQVHGWKSRCLT